MWLQQNVIGCTALVGQAVRSVSNASGPRSIAGGVGACCGWIVAVFGAGDQDALDGAVARIPDGQGAGAGRIEAGIAVGVAQPDDPLDGAQPVDGVDRESSATIATAPGPICSAWVRHHVTLRSVWAILCGG